MKVTAVSLGSPRNGLPEWRPYRWRGKPLPAPGPAPRRRTGWKPGARQERLEALARMRINDKSLNLNHLPHGIVTHEQAAAMFGVTKRTIVRDLQTLRNLSEAS